MSALGHFLEREGIPTVSISLIREHTEAVRPPRALWVTFDLGRPLGLPGDPPFQTRVLRAALELLARTDGPLIADYPEEIDEPMDYSGMACPVNLGPKEVDGLSREVARLMPWYDRAVANNGRTTVGLSNMPISAAGDMVSKALAGELPGARELKFAIDDLMAFYLEAASAFPDPGSAASRKEWLWAETVLAHTLIKLQPKLAESADPQMQRLGKFILIPAVQRHRLG